MSSTTPSPDRADLRTLAAEAVHGFQCHRCSEDGPCRACGGPDAEDHREGAAVLAAVLPEHRRMVLGEAAEAITDNVRNEDWTKQDRGGFYGVAPKMAYVAGHDKAADILRRLAAAAPPAGLSAPVPAENAPAVPEEADGRCVCHPDIVWGWHPTSMGGGHRAIRGVSSGGLFRQRDDGVEQFDSVAGFRATHPEEADGQRAGQGPYRVGRKVGRTIYRMAADQPSDTDELIGVMDSPALAAFAVRGMNAETGTEAALGEAKGTIRRLEIELEHWRTVIVPELREQRDRLGTDRDRLAAQVAYYQRVIEQVRALTITEDGHPLHPTKRVAVADIIAAVDALSDVGTDQTEDDHG